MVLSVVFVAVGIALLAVSADRAVDAAEGISNRLGISPVVIGALVVGLGTSLPEMVVSGLASAQRDTIDLAIANIVGSNAANLTLVLGTGALILPLTGQRETLKREGFIMLGAGGLFCTLVADGELEEWEGLVLLVAMIVAAAILALGAVIAPEGIEGDQVVDDVGTLDLGGADEVPNELRSMVAFTLVGLAGVVGGSQLLVTGATTIASQLAASEAFIGLTVVAIGTSIPELATTVASARRGSASMIIGNVLGSNVFNSLAVGGVAGVAGNGVIASPILPSAMVMVGISAGVVLLGLLAGGINRRWAIILFLGYGLVLGLGV